MAQPLIQVKLHLIDAWADLPAERYRAEPVLLVHCRASVELSVIRFFLE